MIDNVRYDRVEVLSSGNKEDTAERCLGFAQMLGHLGIIIATGAGQVFLPHELRQEPASLVMSTSAVANHTCGVVVS